MVCQYKANETTYGSGSGSQIGVTLSAIESIELGDFQGRGATLQSFFKYAHCMSLSLKDVFIDLVDASDQVSATSLPQSSACQQNFYVFAMGITEVARKGIKANFVIVVSLLCPKPAK